MPMYANSVRTRPPGTGRAALALAVAAVLQLPLAAAQEADADAVPPQKAVTLEEVVVTAQKRSERLQETPVAAAVVSQEALEKANVSDISDLNKLVPSVQLKGTFNGRVPIAMRGISTNADQAAVGLTSGVLVMLDGVPVSSDAAGINELSDLAQVEVLKGPQSTLGGRAASAGVINLITRKPTDYWSGSFGAMATNDGENKFDAFLSGPLGDAAAFSLSAYRHHQVYPIRNIATGRESRTDSEGARLKLLLRPTDALDVTLTAHAISSDSAGGTFTYQYLTEQGMFSGRITEEGIPYEEVMAGIAPRWGNSDYNSPVDMRSIVKGSDYSVNVDYRVGDYTLTSTTAYQQERQYNVQDVGIAASYWLNELIEQMGLTGILPSWDNTQKIILKPSTRSQEFKIASPLDGRVNFVAGLFYSEVEVWNDALRTMFVNPNDFTVHSSTRTLDAYGRVTWKLANDFDLLTGLRYNYDTVGYWKDDRVNGHYSADESTEGTWVGDLSLRKRFSPDAMAYLTYARGYKPLVYNTSASLSSDDPLEPANKETVDHYEAGLKLALLDRALTLNTALFQTTYNDYQVQIYEVEDGSILGDLQLQNAGSVRTRGLEADLGYAASESLRLTAAAAWIDARFLRYGNAPCWGANDSQSEAEGCVNGYQDLSGKSLPDAPRFKANLGADYTWFGGEGRPDLTLSGQYAWRSGTYMQANHNPYTYQPSFGLLNLSLTGSWNSDRFSATLFVNNVFDKFYLVNVTDNFSGIWSDGAVAITGQPARDAGRYAGLRLNWNF